MPKAARVVGLMTIKKIFYKTRTMVRAESASLV